MKVEQYPNNVGIYKDFIGQNWLSYMTNTKMIDNNIMKNTNMCNSYVENEEQEQIEESDLAFSMCEESL